jgi:hypothetical protein
MNRFLDARIPLVFGSAADAGPEDALLLEGQGGPAAGRAWFEADLTTGHPLGCSCCLPRNGAGKALGQLLLDRGRGTGPFFRRVIVAVSTDEGRQQVLSALENDPLASVCYRHEERPGALPPGPPLRTSP